MFKYNSVYNYKNYIFIMAKEEDRQTAINEYESKPVQLTVEAYNILEAVKRQLIKKNKKNHTFSDAVIELKTRSNGDVVKFTREEIIQIKTTLKGGLK